MFRKSAALFYLLSGIVACAAQGCIYSRTGKEYAGAKDRTRSGKACQRWDRKALIKQNLDVANFPDKTLSDAGNYCRNPDNSPDGPWCYTSDPNTPRESCGIGPCDCKTTHTGREYIGHRNYNKRTRCQYWSSNAPNIHKHHDAGKFPDRTLDEAKNYCRNPDNEKGPWCYRNIIWGWDYCSIPACVCRTDEEGTSYIGELTHTKSGLPCRRWESPEYGLMAHTNRCWNPNQDPDGPWCYTTDPDVEKESCDVPRCYFSKQKDPVFDHNPRECKVGQRYNSYSGTATTTVSGKTCQRWDSQRPHAHRFNNPSLFPDLSIEEAANYCRNPDNSTDGPWCYTTDPGTQREACPVKHCECKITRTGREYAGKISRTQAGRTCQRWDAQWPHKHFNDAASQFPDVTLAQAENFCRNPDGEEKGPWCYTTYALDRWDFCRVPMCLDSMIPKEKPPYTTTTHGTTAARTTEALELKNTVVTPSVSPFKVGNHTSLASTYISKTSDAPTRRPDREEDKTHRRASSTSKPAFHETVPERQTSEFSTVEYVGIGGGSTILIIIGMIYIAGFVLKRQKQRVTVHLTGDSASSRRYV